MESRIEAKLREALSPTYLLVVNESSGHCLGPETHFKVVVVSEAFAGLGLVERHRAVNTALAEELSVIHALSIKAKTPEQWAKSSAVHETPKSFVTHMTPKELYRALLWAARSAPGGYLPMRDKIKEGFRKNINETDPKTIKRLVLRGKKSVVEIQALSSLHKYRSLHKRYTGEED